MENRESYVLSICAGLSTRGTVSCYLESLAVGQGFENIGLAKGEQNLGIIFGIVDDQVLDLRVKLGLQNR